MRVDAAITDAVERLAAAGAPAPRLAAETLLQGLLSQPRAYLFAHPERELSPEQSTRFSSDVARLVAGEPLQYVTGHQEFWGLDFAVSPSVLIPRPETELLVEASLELARSGALPASPRILDVGCGSGAIIVALASELPEASLTAVDISPQALAAARRNAERLGAATRIRFLQSDLLASLAGERFDLIVSNPPYVSSGDEPTLQRQVREHEPRLALYAGADGLDVYRRLIPQALSGLSAEGRLLMEMGCGQGEALRALLAGWRDVELRQDLSGLERCVLARRPAL